MSGAGDKDVSALEKEVEALRAQVRELKRAAALEQEQVDPALVEREELLREVERVVHLGTWNWDFQTNRVTWSDELYRILGLEPGSVPASVERYYASMHPEDRAIAEANGARGIQEGMLPPFDGRLIRPDGSVRQTTSYSAAIFDNEGRPRRFVGAVLDRTELLETEAELRRTLELLRESQRIAHVGSYRFVPTLGILEWSQEFRRIIGVSNDVTPSIEVFLERLVPEDVERFAAIYERQSNDLQSSEAEAKIRRPDGEIRHLRISSEVFQEPGGERELRGALMDVTESVRMSEGLVQAQKMEAIGRLAAGIAHDFNNLLTVVSGNLELYRQQTREAPELDDSLRALESAKQLTARLLAFGRKARLALKVLDPNELVRSTLQLLQRLVGDEVALETELTGDLGPIRVDPVEVERALVNLVVNARDALAEGGKVKISTAPLHSEGVDFVAISVADNGPGIEDSALARIFEPFYTTRWESGGTGLGLSSVLGTAEQHGGTVKVKSEVGVGTTFTILLPVCDGNLGESLSPPSVRRPNAPRELSILLIDDDPKVSEITSRMLEVTGHRVEVAHTPQEAIAFWTEASPPFDLVICDIAMPEMRGTTLVQRLADIGPEPRVLFITGYSDEGPENTRGAPVLTKPFSVSALRKAVDNALSL